MSASHNSSGSSTGSSTSVPTGSATVPLAQQISPMGSNSAGWLNELQTLGYTPNTGSWNGVGANTATNVGSSALAQPVANNNLQQLNALQQMGLLGSLSKGSSS